MGLSVSEEAAFVDKQGIANACERCLHKFPHAAHIFADSLGTPEDDGQLAAKNIGALVRWLVLELRNQ